MGRVSQYPPSKKYVLETELEDEKTHIEVFDPFVLVMVVEQVVDFEYIGYSRYTRMVVSLARIIRLGGLRTLGTLTWGTLEFLGFSFSFVSFILSFSYFK